MQIDAGRRFCGQQRTTDRDTIRLVAQTPQGVTPTPTNLSTSLRLDPLDDARFAPGHIFASRYRIVSFLGRGAMGEVYRADDLRLGQAVALKLMSEAMAQRHDGLRRLTDEVRLARTVVHPNVCRVYDIGHADGWHFLSMEYVDGETLGSLMLRIGQLPILKALEMTRQLCVGMAAAHDRGVLHRDLKPSNIMVDGRGQIRIMDFGLAVTAQSEVREIAGTPAYMPPEQRAGEAVTKQSDLYSLGRVLAEILPPGINPELTTAVRACTEADRAKRPASAYAIVAALPAGTTIATELSIPTPAMVAATPIAGAMRPAVAWLLLAAMIGGTLVVASQAHVLNVAPSQVPKPPEVLAERAREVLAQKDPSAPAADRAFWFWRSDAGQILFTYRGSPRPLIPANLFRVVTIGDPPIDAAALTVVTLDAEGIPSSVKQAPHDLWTTGRAQGGELAYWIGILLGIVTSAILARRNLRAGEGDRAGAWRLSVFVCCGSLVAATLRAHHVPSLIDELSWLLGVTGWALLWSGFSWLAYVSFEPYGRRWWPNTLVSWTRLLVGFARDPLVGRDVLLGSLAGVAAIALHVVQFELTGRTGAPVFSQPAVDALRSSAAFASLAVFAFLDGLMIALFAVAGLVLFRLIFRKAWIAMAVLVALSSLAMSVSASSRDVAVAVVIGTLSLGVLLRVGFLAFVAMMITVQFLTWLPITLDGSAWYFGQSLVVLLAIAAMATYGFLLVLNRRPAFGEFN
jgi:predicted Ser/Thr protein kinase